MRRKKRELTFKYSTYTLIAACLVVLFQNCSPVKVSSVSTKLSSSSGGNGDGYEGKPGIYDHAIVAQPCSDIGADGQPLPNNEIFRYLSGKTQLVRKDCVDLSPPIDIDPSTIVVNAATKTITVSGESFSERPQGDFAVVASQCPSGMTPKANAVRTNMLSDSQYVADSSSAWWIEPGLASSLVGSLGSLPVWDISRNTSTSEYWRRAEQDANLVAGKTYSYTTYVKPGTIDAVSMFFWQCGNPCDPNNPFMNVYVTFNMTAQTSQVVQTPGASNMSTRIQPFAGGYILTVYFTALGSFLTDTGIGPYSSTFLGQQGDSILATAFQLEDVSNYCQ